MRWIHSIIIPYYRTSNISYNTTYHILSIYLITRSLANPINVPYDTPSDTPSPHFTTPLSTGPALVEYLSQRNITHSYDAPLWHTPSPHYITAHISSQHIPLYNTPSQHTPSPHFTTPLTIGPALVEYLSQRNITHSYDAGGGEMEVTIRPKWWWGYVRVALHQRCSTAEWPHFRIALLQCCAIYDICSLLDSGCTSSDFGASEQRNCSMVHQTVRIVASWSRVIAGSSALRRRQHQWSCYYWASGASACDCLVFMCSTVLYHRMAIEWMISYRLVIASL